MSRIVIRYAFYQLDPAWRALPDEDRAAHRKELSGLLATAHTYSCVGLREDADFCVWQLAPRAEDVQELQASLNCSGIGRFLRCTHSYLAMTRPSPYTKDHKHSGSEQVRGPEPVGSPYLFVYPMDKLRSWYALPFDERRRMMGRHIAIGHKYPNVHIHTGYSFGLDDQEFVVAFESDSLESFLELVMELRESEASAYTARDVPIFTCVKMGIDAIMAQLDG